MQVSEIIKKYRARKGALISILQDIQTEYNWLSKETITEVSKKLGIPLINIYEVASFYKAFSLKPRGEHIITVCMGTACHVRGAPRILDELSRELNIEPGETTEDMQFTLETVNCLGCCAIGPVVVIDGEYHGGMNPTKATRLLKRYKK